MRERVIHRERYIAVNRQRGRIGVYGQVKSRGVGEGKERPRGRFLVDGTVKRKIMDVRGKSKERKVRKRQRVRIMTTNNRPEKIHINDGETDYTL